MTWWVWLLLIVYAIGFGLTIHFHAVMAPNATPALIFLRAGIWPVYWATGWPQGMRLPMD